MKHTSRDDVAIQALLRRARTVVAVGASPRARRHSHRVCRFLHDQGFEVIPVRPDREDVAGLKSYARFSDVPGSVDIVVIFRSRDAAPEHIAELEDNPPEVVWLPPGVWSRACDAEAERLGVGLAIDACIEEEVRRSLRSAAKPRKLGAHQRRRKKVHEDNRVRPDDRGYVADGGGGHAGGGGVRATLDEKKMVAGRPSPRKGVFKTVEPPRLQGRHRRRRAG